MTPHQELSNRDVRRNFLCLVWMGSVFALGWSEVTMVLQPMLVHFGASNQQIGMVQAVLIWTLPGMFLSPWITRRFRYKKIYLYVVDTLYLLPLGLVGAAVWFGVSASHGAMVGFIVWMMLAGQVAAGFGGLPNQEFYTSCIPMRMRGRLAGVSASIGGMLGLLAAPLAAWMLKTLPSPQGFGAVLVLAWLLCQVADSAVLFAKEPPTPVDASPQPWGREMWRAFFRDRRFLRVVVAACLVSPLLGQLAVFSSVFAFRDLKFEAQMGAWLVGTASACRMALSPAAGWLTDRWGARPSLLLWTACGAIGFAVLAIHPGVVSVFLAAGIAAVAYSGFSGALNALTSGIPAPEHRAGHFTLLGLCMVVMGSLVPLLVGGMFDRISYRSGFAVLAVLGTLIAGFCAWWLRGLSRKAEDYC